VLRSASGDDGTKSPAEQKRDMKDADMYSKGKAAAGKKRTGSRITRQAAELLNAGKVVDLTDPGDPDCDDDPPLPPQVTRKRQKMAPAKPKVKKPVKSYMLFSKIFRAPFAADDPSLSPKSVCSALGRLWRGLSDDKKELYKDVDSEPDDVADAFKTMTGRRMTLAAVRAAAVTNMFLQATDDSDAPDESMAASISGAR
jgi:hypothetical protein